MNAFRERTTTFCRIQKILSKNENFSYMYCPIISFVIELNDEFLRYKQSIVVQISTGFNIYHSLNMQHIKIWK